MHLRSRKRSSSGVTVVSGQKKDIPAGTRMRRATVSDRIRRRARWLDIDDAVTHGIGHQKDPSSVFFSFLNPGTAMNPGDHTREPSRKCNDEEGVLVLWTVKDIRVGEEMFNEYADDFRSRAW